MNGTVWNIIACLDSDVHEATKSVIEGNPMRIFNLFQLFYNNNCIHEEFLLKGCIHWEI